MATVESEVDVESGLDWKSPLRKLVRFFQRSRNRWKSKYAAKKHECKLLGNQVRAVEKSRAKWRRDAEQAQQQVRELQYELEQYKKSSA
jgi:hypothetical protein